MASLPASAVVHAPLPPDRAEWLARLTDGLGTDALWWLSGYAAGLARLNPADAGPIADAGSSGKQRLTVVFGSQTGNARRLAETIAARTEAAGLPVRLLRADAYPLRELASERLLYLVISTQGDGDPPDDALNLVEHLQSRRAPRLDQLRFAVLGLGDSSYPKFCEIGRQLDARLAELGGHRLFERGDADLDLESVATPWLERALDAARDELKSATPLATVTPLRPAAPAPAWSRDKPFAAEVLANQRITDPASRKDVRHLELSLAGSGLHYQPGDALGMWPRNAPALVQAILAQLRLDGDALVAHAGQERPLRNWLQAHRELTRLARPFLAAHAERAPTLAPLLLPDQAPALAQLLASNQLPDLLQHFPAHWDARELVATLRPLAPRLYSIASSQAAIGDEIHLTVDHLRWQAVGGERWGAASHALATADEGDTLSVYVESNDRFRLPTDAGRDVIMIGPGTGIAPFRGFVQHRAAVGATGRNWLFFGNPHARHDFLYQLEWQQALTNGQLHRLDLAFSRDQAEKIYVQHRLQAQGRAVFDWLENGAHLYVCGDASRMAADVEAALLAVIAEHGGRDQDAAREYLAALRQQGRYARDVY